MQNYWLESSNLIELRYNIAQLRVFLKLVMTLEFYNRLFVVQNINYHLTKEYYLITHLNLCHKCHNIHELTPWS
jgi:hypothetical protein